VKDVMKPYTFRAALDFFGSGFSPCNSPYTATGNLFAPIAASASLVARTLYSATEFVANRIL